ncbi:putative RDD family membrane protein YckC [Duganella sp. 3397]|uniref:RDD family protein n=1 Tax=Duganella sp. 3397 TaxID=2817732 RepID=UPI002862B54C|nr:RDD family protein [Duganella sp. 3397]MDR7049846.1 putative RDD family membrane protein YckC [Duganella sp. 3397]
MLPNNATTLPTVKRRLVSMVYEFLLAFAVLFLPFLIFEMLTGASHAPLVEHLRQVLAFVVLGIYFVHQWTREGQTLAMRTWRLRLIHPGHERVAPRVAMLRYLLCWLWVLPAVIVCGVFGLQHWQALGTVLAGILLWSLTALLDKDRQFLHDRLAGTRLVQLPAPPKKHKTPVHPG